MALATRVVGRPGCAAGALLAIALFGVSVAELRVIEGPTELVGLSLASPRFHFSPLDFRVRARLELVEYVDFDYDATSARTCVGRYLGNRTLRGAIVVHINVPWQFCTPESHARALGELGAVGWVQANEGDVLWQPVPGYNGQVWMGGDTRALARPVAVDITSSAMVPLLRALRAGRAIVVDVTPDVNEHTTAFDSWHFTFCRVVCAVQAWLVIELCIGKLHAFVQSEGGLRASSLPQVLIAVELLTNSLRFAWTAIEPFYRARVLPLRINVILFTSHTQALTSVSAVVFLAYYADGAATSGLASFRITQSRYRWAVAAFAVAALLGPAALETISFTVPPLFFNDFMIYKIFLITSCFPAVALLVSIVVTVRIRQVLRKARTPPIVMQRITGYMARSIGFELVTMAVGSFYMWAIVGPWRRTWYQTAMYVLFIAKSFQHVDCFQAAGVQEVRGPLNRVHDAYLITFWLPCVSWLRQWACPPRVIAPLPAVESINARDDDGRPLPQHLLLGVSLTFLRDLFELLRLEGDEPTLRVSELLRSDPAFSGCSVCERHVHSVASDGMPAVGMATLFVSHAQSCSFNKLIDALELFLEQGFEQHQPTFLWLDAVSIRQQNVEADVHLIGAIERKVRRVVMVLDPWDAPVCLTRVWCLFEVVHCALPLGAELMLTMARSERLKFIKALQTDRRQVERILTAFDARRAEATVAADKAMIFNLIENSFGAAASPGSAGALDVSSARSQLAFNEFNELVRAAIIAALGAMSWQIHYISGVAREHSPNVARRSDRPVGTSPRKVSVSALSASERRRSSLESLEDISQRSIAAPARWLSRASSSASALSTSSRRRSSLESLEDGREHFTVAASEQPTATLPQEVSSSVSAPSASTGRRSPVEALDEGIR